MAKYEFKDPDYVGVWTRIDSEPKTSIFMAFVEWKTLVGDESTEWGRMFDSRGFSDFEIARKGDEARVSVKYIPSLSRGYSGGIECTGKGVEGFVTGKWNEGEFSAARFENSFLCNNPSMQLLFAQGYEKLSADLVKLARASQLLICDALRGISQK